MSVDFPMPGSPPMRIKDPGTMPPPNVRLSSLSLVTMRDSRPCSISLSLFGCAMRCVDANVERRSFFPTSCFCMTSSRKVFHELHDGHFPSHLADSYPQC